MYKTNKSFRAEFDKKNGDALVSEVEREFKGRMTKRMKDIFELSSPSEWENSGAGGWGYIDPQDYDRNSGKRLTSIIISKREFDSYLRVFQAIFDKKTKNIKSKSGKYMFRGVKASMKLGRATILATNLTNPFDLKTQSVVAYGGRKVFYSGSRTAHIYLDDSLPDTKKYYKASHSNPNVIAQTHPLLKASMLSRSSNTALAKKWHTLLYMPYYINNQPISKKRAFLKYIGANGNMSTLYGAKKWWRKQDKGFIDKIVNEFNSSEDIPSWATLTANKKIYK